MNFERNPVREILETPDNLDVEGAREIKLTDASEFIQSLRTEPGEPRPEVYEYRTTVLPAHEILPMSQVKDVVVSLYQDVEDCRQLPEVATLSLDDFRAWLMEKNPKYKEFFKKLPRLFRKIVGPNSKQDRKHVFRLIEMRRVQERLAMSKQQREAQVGAYFRENFSRAAKPGEEEAAVAAGTGYSGTAMTRDQVRHELLQK
jgi:hypothetical protein